MRLGVFLIQFPVSSETFIVTKLLGLVDAGIDVVIFVTRESKEWDRFEILRTRSDVRERIVVLPSAGLSSKFLRKELPKFIRKVVKHPREFVQFYLHCWRYRKQNPSHFLMRLFSLSGFLGQKLDILHVEFDTQGLFVADLKYFLGCKLTMSARGTHMRTSIPYRYPQEFRNMLTLADGYHTISKYLHNELTRLGLPSATPVWLIEPAIDINLFSPPQEKINDENIPVFHVLSVARLAWAKGYEFALDAISLLQKQGINFHYTIVGDGAYKDAIYFAAHQHGLVDQGLVTFAGKVGREEIIDYYIRSDVLLHVSLEEGFANAVIEAQAMGLPVVCSDAGGLPENVEDGVTGFVVPRRNAVATAEKLAFLARNPEIRYQMGQAGIKRVRNKFDIKDQIKKFLEMYGAIIRSEIEN